MTVFEKLKEMPNNTSECIRRAVHQAHADPEVLVLAFKLRLAMPECNDKRVVAYSAEERFAKALDELGAKTKLSLDEVVRLCLEAYVYRL